MTPQGTAQGFGERVDEALGVIGRLIAFAAVSLAVLFLIGVALKPILPDGLPPGREGRAIFTMLASLSLVVGHVVVVPLFERMRWEVAGLAAAQWDPRWLLGGALAGALGILLPAAVLLATGRAEVVVHPAGALAEYLVDGALLVGAASAMEELVWRGYVFGLIADRWGGGAAVAATSLLFAAVTGLSPAAEPFTIVAILALGVLLATIRRRAGLAAAWLAHAALGATQALLLRTPARGVDLEPPGWQLIATGPSWLTGGRWGFEGGAAVALTLLVITFLVSRIPRSPRRT